MSASHSGLGNRFQLVQHLFNLRLDGILRRAMRDVNDLDVFLLPRVDGGWIIVFPLCESILVFEYPGEAFRFLFLAAETVPAFFFLPFRFHFPAFRLGVFGGGSGGFLCSLGLGRGGGGGGFIFDDDRSFPEYVRKVLDERFKL
jgi:hypothetical protein